MKGLKIEGRRIEEAVKEVMKEVRAIVDVEEVRRTGDTYKEKREMVASS